jgi:aminoglycoside phosphotransferase
MHGQIHESLRAAILRMLPEAMEIVEIRPYRPEFLPYPARVTLQTASRTLAVCVVKTNASLTKLAHEAQVLSALAELKLTVPPVLGGPETIATEAGPLAVMLLGELPGQPLPWLGLTDLAVVRRTSALLQEAVDVLHHLTPYISSHPIAVSLPSVTLESELDRMTVGGGRWLRKYGLASALTVVRTSLPHFPAALVFSNGDYNPINFLVKDEELSGWLDFEYACFEDPYIGFAKFILWADDDFGWGAGAKIGLVEDFLSRRMASPESFLPRLILRGLRYLHDNYPAEPPAYMIRVIDSALGRLRQVLS